MSSKYLTSSDMNTIERLLSEVREQSENRSFEKETARSLMLIQAVQSGVRQEDRLRVLLAKHVARHQIIDYPIAEWENEGGSVST